jgi:D-alanyl-D-alanine carboxypeptidase
MGNFPTGWGVVVAMMMAMSPVYAQGGVPSAAGTEQLQAAIAASAKQAKAAAFLDVQGCGLSFSAVSGMADRISSLPATTDMPLRLGSVGKLYTAAVIHRLAARGLLDLDVPVSQYLLPQDAAGVAGRGATLRQLLNHSSGIPDYYALPDIARWDWSKALTPERILAAISGRAATGAPGVRYAYSNSGYHVAALAAERAAKRPFADLMQAELIEPLALRATRYHTAAPAGPLHGYVGKKDWWYSAENTGPDSGITAPLADLRRYLDLLFLGEGPMTAIGAAMTDGPIETGKLRQQAGAGAEVRVSRGGLRLVGHTGNVEGYLTFAYAAPDHGLTMIGHLTASDTKTFQTLLQTTGQVAAAACGLAPPTE